SIQDLSQRTRDKKLVYKDINDGTFTLSNWGTFGVSYGTPVICRLSVCHSNTHITTKSIQFKFEITSPL
ncbi:MAG: 2-oxo acid dehydrogenase subunit E2, partial [Candidatus Phytoplasma australasiaticum]|nr:2-oxo acid dehydrogenase subunit E2 [Candidatus Phytoplasma australasiaticum]